MRVYSAGRTLNGDVARVTAKVDWEDCDRPAQEIYFETILPFADSLTDRSHAFVVAACIAAMRHGERRLAVDSGVCPELKQGLHAAMRLLQSWYDPDRRVVDIEAKTAEEQPANTGRSAGFFFTGGVDSLATLRANHTIYPKQHPGHFRDGLLIFGLEVDRRDAFDCVVDVLSMLAREAGITLIPISTNVRTLDESWRFWTDEFEAAALASSAHALDRRLSSATIGSSFDFRHLHPHGSHPLLDPSYGSSQLRIRHDGVAWSRLDKIRVIAEWAPALRSLRVCNRPEYYRPGIVNCGTCEKCLRTLTALMIVGRLAETSTFANTELTGHLLEANVKVSKTNYPFWCELVDPLDAMGREDLARPVRNALLRYRRKGRWAKSLSAFDRLHLDGRLRKLKRAVLSSEA